MTGIRQSFVSQLEASSGFGKGLPSGQTKWMAPPPGAFFDATANRQTNMVYGAGNKFREAAVYGQFSGTWTMTFILDYGYLEPFLLAFEDVNGAAPSTTAAYDNTTKKVVFKKVNNKRVPSFVVRQKKLNSIVGGGSGDDELRELYGCVVQQISFARSASTSQYQVTMSGVYTDEAVVIGALSATDYQDKTTDLVEYSCLYAGAPPTQNSGDTNYIGNVESLSFSIGNNVGMQYNACAPFATTYYEGRSQFQFSASAYSVNPKAFRTRVYSGGKDNTHTQPMAKGLGPMASLSILSFDKSQLDDSSYTTISAAYAGSTKQFTVKISDAVIKSIKYQNGDGSKIMDSLSSVDCKSIELEFYNSTATSSTKVWPSGHEVTSSGTVTTARGSNVTRSAPPAGEPDGAGSEGGDETR